MKKALIEPPSRVAQVVAVGDDFPVASPLRWVDAPDEVTTAYTFDAGTGMFTPPLPPPPPPVNLAIQTLKAKLDAVLADPLVPQSVKDALGALRNTLP